MKKYIAMLAAAVIALSSGLGTYAQSSVKTDTAASVSSDKALADAIAAAKQYITVPEERKQVDYNIRQGEYGGMVTSVSWSNNDGSTDVALDKDGCLLSYHEYDNGKVDKKGLAKLGSDSTKKAADTFMKRVYAEGATSFKLEDSGMSRYTHRYSYRLYINDIPVTNGSASVSVDPDTGKIMSFDGIGKEFLSLKYPSAEGTVGINAAMKALYSDSAPEPRYIISTDYTEKKITKSAFLAFIVSDISKGINAFSGKETVVNNYFNEVNAKKMAEETSAAFDADGAGSGARNYTAEELAAIDDAADVISAERAQEIIKGYFPIAKNIDFKSSSITKDTYTEEYFIRITADNASALLNAKTGAVKSFGIYSEKPDTKSMPVSESKAKEITSELLNKIAPAESKKVDTAVYTGDKYSSYSYISYPRIENGYLCNNQQINFTINEDGEITNFNNNFDNKIVFPKPSGVLTDDKAIEALAKVFNFDLAYSVGQDYGVTLLYHFDKSGYMDSSSAVQLDYSGKPVKDTEVAGISDVYGHWSEKYVTALYNNGCKLNDTLFRPDQPITADELKTFYGGYKYMPYYIDSSEDTENDGSKEVTRYELAQYIMSYYGLDKLKDHPALFAPVGYSDVIKEEYVPAVAIATELGAMNGDNTNSFNGDKPVTRAEAAVALYNMLTAEQ